ncbi:MULTISPECIES: hypothetical protein [unclassified Streptomyces]|uniref:hypothetical protein n=1 Tax=unclassified Streptomyces TaxID=2593676 RepID=UPI001BE6B6CE|nr:MULTISPECIES: hypothetical protein [unclassified Streptomyces]MBT2405028.1 hypothetical protein [Streptomyces sp. ISL-21]MBT2457000.1 hypothetical protein [Streptomyces sp. ISL-86]MBT2610754.1 hypothetical protein [Streptomyces sp. ISL-87]
MAVLGLLAWFASSHAGSGSDSPQADTSPSSTTAPCPGRIADEIPEGDGSELVEAFQTDNKQITLCRTSGGTLYYFGEFSDHREKGIAMRAEKTPDGYEARNDPYRYVIHDGVVTIYKSGDRIGQEPITSEPSPK